MCAMLSGLFIRGHNGCVVLANKTITVSLRTSIAGSHKNRIFVILYSDIISVVFFSQAFTLGDFFIICKLSFKRHSKQKPY